MQVSRASMAPDAAASAGTTYSEFIRMMHLPSQLAHVDPIVASFCGGAVGVLSAFMVVEANNAKAQEKKRCQYCEVRLASVPATSAWDPLEIAW